MLPKTVAAPRDEEYPRNVEAIPKGNQEAGRYVAHFARSAREMRSVLRLRYQVFNLELGEGLEASHHTGMDQDPLDAYCHHLMVTDRTSGEVVGTYRLQTDTMAHGHQGFYSAAEFDLSVLPREITESCVELGRACIALAHRNRQVLFLLWKGLALYLLHNRRRFLFGCSSLTSQDPRDGLRMLRYLDTQGYLHPTLQVPPRADIACQVDPATAAQLAQLDPQDVNVPSLFRTYLRYGAKICGAPAIDREFKTIDFFMLFDLESLDERRYRLFFG
jgi:putative hemolysin